MELPSEGLYGIINPFFEEDVFAVVETYVRWIISDSWQCFREAQPLSAPVGEVVSNIEPINY